MMAGMLLHADLKTAYHERNRRTVKVEEELVKNSLALSALLLQFVKTKSLSMKAKTLLHHDWKSACRETNP